MYTHKERERERGKRPYIDTHIPIHIQYTYTHSTHCTHIHTLTQHADTHTSNTIIHIHMVNTYLYNTHTPYIETHAVHSHNIIK